MEALLRVLPEGLPVSLQVVAATIVLGIVYSLITADRPFTGIPVLHIDGQNDRKSFMFNGRETLKEGLKRFSGPFQVVTGTGPKIVVPNRFANELRNHPSLNFNKAFAKDFPINYPGFEPHRQGITHDHLVQETVRVKLTQSLGLVTNDLVDETIASVHDVFGDNKEWTTRTLRDDIIEVVARLSSRVFLGPNLCRNRRWLEISKSYTIDSFMAAGLMRAAPALLRPIVYLLLPQSKRLRRAMKDAREMIDPEVERRKAIVDAAYAAGEKAPKVADTIGWMYEVARGEKVDLVAGQLTLTMAAIHTTTETSCQAVLDICQYPEVAQQMREEIVQVIGEHGWAKTSLYKLRLMDSFLKEGQRLRPLASDIELSDGTVLPKGSRLIVSSSFMDPKIYPEPEKFDAARFVKMRQEPGQENGWQFVTTSPEHILFGHGQHACPGRFFASNEIKILLCHLLLKYEWRLVPGEERPVSRMFEVVSSFNPEARIQMRRRTPELDLDNL